MVAQQPGLSRAWDWVRGWSLAERRCGWPIYSDTLPFNAHTTASDALWAGLPVMTCMDTAFPGRVGASILKAVGVPELITHSLADYEALALRLARDPTALAAVKVTLAKNRTVHPLFDTKRFARNLESAFATVWERQQQGLSARSFAVS